MWRNIICQSVFQLILLLLLLFQGAQWFGVHEGVTCERYKIKSNTGSFSWDLATHGFATPTSTDVIGCSSYKTYCASKGIDCIEDERTIIGSSSATAYELALTDLEEWENICLECNLNGYVHGSIIFNAFIFCQFFNEYTARSIFDDPNCLKGILGNYVFLFVSIVTAGCQIFLIEIGGEFVKTSPLNASQWLITIALGAIGIPVGILMRFIPCPEDPNSFFDNTRSFDHVAVPEPTTPHGEYIAETIPLTAKKENV